MVNDEPAQDSAHPNPSPTQATVAVRARPGSKALAGVAVACLLVGMALGAVIASAGQGKPPSPAPQIRKVVVGQPVSGAASINESVGEPAKDAVDGSELDAFNRPNQRSGLGGVNGDRLWHAVMGTWGIVTEQAYVSVPAAKASIAVLAPAVPVLAAQVRVTAVTDRAGLVFRYQDPDNYWAVVALPHYGTWAVLKVVGGNQSVVTNTGVVPTGDGTLVAVSLHGAVIDVLINNVTVRSVTDAALQGAAGVGMTASGQVASQARFTDFRVTPNVG